MSESLRKASWGAGRKEGRPGESMRWARGDCGLEDGEERPTRCELPGSELSWTDTHTWTCPSSQTLAQLRPRASHLFTWAEAPHGSYGWSCPCRAGSLPTPTRSSLQAPPDTKQGSSCQSTPAARGRTPLRLSHQLIHL